MDICQLQLDLPNDIWRVIFSLISSLETLIRLQRVCKLFKREIKLTQVYKLFAEARMTAGKFKIIII